MDDLGVPPFAETFIWCFNHKTGYITSDDESRYLNDYRSSDMWC